MEIRIHYVVLPDTPDLDFIQRWTPQLPTSMQKGITSFVFEMDQMRGLIAKLLVWRTIDPLLTPAESLEKWKTNEYGCPSLPDRPYFNLSHSGNLVALAVADEPLGIDLELIREVDFELLKNYMTSSHWKDILSAANPQARFFHYWTVKEALMKAEGMGFHLPLEEIDLQGDRAVIRDRIWYLKTLALERGYAAHLASQSSNPQVTVHQEYFF